MKMKNKKYLKWTLEFYFNENWWNIEFKERENGKCQISTVCVMEVKVWQRNRAHRFSLLPHSTPPSLILSLRYFAIPLKSLFNTPITQKLCFFCFFPFPVIGPTPKNHSTTNSEALLWYVCSPFNLGFVFLCFITYPDIE